MESNIAISKRFDNVHQNCESLRIAAPFFNTDFPCRSTDRPSLLSNGAPCSDHKNVGCHIPSPHSKKEEFSARNQYFEVIGWSLVASKITQIWTLFVFLRIVWKKKTSSQQTPEASASGHRLWHLWHRWHRRHLRQLAKLLWPGLQVESAVGTPAVSKRWKKQAPTNRIVEPADLLQGSFLYFLWSCSQRYVHKHNYVQLQNLKAAWIQGTTFSTSWYRMANADHLGSSQTNNNELGAIHNNGHLHFQETIIPWSATPLVYHSIIVSICSNQSSAPTAVSRAALKPSSSMACSVGACITTNRFEEHFSLLSSTQTQ